MENYLQLIQEQKKKVDAQIWLKELGKWDKCTIQMHNSGMIQILKMQRHSLTAALTFMREVFLPQLDGLIRQAEDGKEDEMDGNLGAIAAGATVDIETECPMCRENFGSKSELRDHYEVEHAMDDVELEELVSTAGAKRKRSNSMGSVKYPKHFEVQWALRTAQGNKNQELMQELM